jgi:hypothetical protein
MQNGIFVCNILYYHNIYSLVSQVDSFHNMLHILCSQDSLVIQSNNTGAVSCCILGLLWLYSHFFDRGWFFSFLIFTIVDRTLWTGDQSVGRHLPAHRKTQTENKHTQTQASSGIITHDPSVWAGEHVSCLRPRDHCDRRSYMSKKE